MKNLKKFFCIIFFLSSPVLYGADDIFSAAGQGDIYKIKLAIEHGGSPESKNSSGKKPADIALAAGHRQAAAFLRSLKVVKYADGARYTGQTKNRLEHGWGVYITLKGTMYSGSFENGKAAGLGIWRDEKGRLFGGDFSGKGSAQTVRLAENEVYAVDSFGESPLFRAVKSGSLMKARILADRGADIDMVSSNHQRPVHYAAFEGKTEILAWLLSKGADVNRPDEDGMSPLHFAAFSGSGETVSLLIRKGASVNAVNGNGSTPLHLAVFTDNTDAVRVLLAAGADLDAEDSSGRTPMDHAVILKNRRVLTLLQSKKQKN